MTTSQQRQQKVEQIEIKILDTAELSMYNTLSEEGKSHREAINAIIAYRLESNQ